MEYMIPACSGKRIEVKQGQTITVIDVDGGQVVDFFAEITGNEGEFLSPGVTIDCNESLRLKVGDTVYTNLYHPMMKVIADDVGEHEIYAQLPDHCTVRWTNPYRVTQEAVDKVWELYEEAKKYVEEKKKAPGREQM